jgi:recombination protein RecA
MSQALRKLAGSLNRANTVMVFTNQLREKVGVMFGSPEVTPGGRALKFYSSIRLDIRRIETLKEGTEAVGNRCRVKVVKNKMAPPFKQAEFEITYGEGVSQEGSIIDLGVEHKIVTKSGAYFSYGDTRLGQGRVAAKAFLKEHPDVAQTILAQILEISGVPMADSPVVQAEAATKKAATEPTNDADLKPVTGNGRKAAAVS